MIYYIGGENNYESRKSLAELESEYVEMGYALKSIDISENTEFSSLFESFGNLGLFAEKNIYVIKGLGEGGKDQEIALLEVIEKGSDLILYSRGRIDKRSKIYKHVKANGKVVDCAMIQKGKIQKWINKKVQDFGLNIQPQIIAELVLRIGENQNILEFELEKLAALQEEGVEITIEVVKSICSDIQEVNIWDMVDSLNTSKVKSLKLLDGMMKNSEYEQVMGLFGRQLRLLYLAAATRGSREGLISLGVNPFVASKLMRQAAGLNLDRIKRMYQKMLGIEIAVRQGRLDKMLALDLLVIAF